MKTTALRIYDHGTMLPDYFQGTTGLWLNISIDKNTTRRQVIESLTREVSLYWDALESVADVNDFDGDLRQQLNAQFSEMWSRNEKELDEPLDPTLDLDFSEDPDPDYFSEPPYRIFTIEFEE